MFLKENEIGLPFSGPPVGEPIEFKCEITSAEAKSLRFIAQNHPQR
jgi:hypothetical protein